MVRGRLMTIENFNFTNPGPDATGGLQADVAATIYLTPADQGTSAGASPSGPAGTASGGSQQSGSQSTPTPAATATP